ncbi:hypothetical protein IWQ60_010653 [Tieghemiomyces parasiticus]|uniref:F-box domain-containing protein n=1 Tax=Tieghemiomyces parasiticus TaxID=78921 RepID=A0A9W8DN99_9FUNG|nr:hypothetical protein IWQ60_010653 [Tieghemiomyces parasiticus]
MAILSNGLIILAALAVAVITSPVVASPAADIHRLPAELMYKTLSLLNVRQLRKLATLDSTVSAYVTNLPIYPGLKSLIEYGNIMDDYIASTNRPSFEYSSPLPPPSSSLATLEPLLQPLVLTCFYHQYIQAPLYQKFKLTPTGDIYRPAVPAANRPGSYLYPLQFLADSTADATHLALDQNADEAALTQIYRGQVIGLDPATTNYVVRVLTHARWSGLLERIDKAAEAVPVENFLTYEPTDVHLQDPVGLALAVRDMDFLIRLLAFLSRNPVQLALSEQLLAWIPIEHLRLADVLFDARHAASTAETPFPPPAGSDDYATRLRYRVVSTLIEHLYISTVAVFAALGQVSELVDFQNLVRTSSATSLAFLYHQIPLNPTVLLVAALFKKNEVVKAFAPQFSATEYDRVIQLAESGGWPRVASFLKDSRPASFANERFVTIRTDYPLLALAHNRAGPSLLHFTSPR